MCLKSSKNIPSTQKRFKKGLDTYLRTFLNPFGKSVQELTDEYREKFLFDEGKNLKIGDTMVTGPGGLTGVTSVLEWVFWTR